MKRNTTMTRLLDSHRFAATALMTAAALTATPALAETWIGPGGTGDSGEYTVGTNWSGGNVPNTAGGGTATINSGDVTYTPGGDIAINNGGTLEINGGSWTQVDGGAWIQLGGGNLVVAGGTFNQGTSGNIVRNAATTISVSAGTANFNGNFIYEATATGALNITGGTVNVANEFKPVETFTMSAGTLSVGNLISFADGPGSILFTGGTIVLDGSGVYSGFYGGDAGTKSLNFTSGSTGLLRFENYTAAELDSDNFLTNSTIQVNGVTDAAAFLVTESNGGVNVTLIPEPASLALMGLGGLLILNRRRHA